MRSTAWFFDFDGVLVESVSIKTDAFRALYADQPAPVLERIMEHHRSTHGISRVVKIQHCHEHFLGRAVHDDELAALAARYSRLVEEAVVGAPEVPGATDLLERLHASHPLFVVSGTPEEELNRIAHRRGLTKWLTEVRGSPMTKADIVRELSEKHGLMLSGSVFVGDAMADWEAASATGLEFIGRVPSGQESPFPEGTRTVPDLRALLPSGAER